MSEKELIKKWKDLKLIIEENNSKLKIQDMSREEKKKNQQQSYGGKTKVLTTMPKSKYYDFENTETKNHQGYASALLLGLLTFIFQILLVSIAYIMIK
ncbi:MAG: hypothetical protein PHX03_00805 [Bacilli bacterium]|nr:hypothetical protein [Bacilli bacterium]